MPNCEQKYFKYLATNSSISLGIKYTSDLYRPWGALNSSKKTKKYNPRYFWANTSMIVRLVAHKKCTCAYLSMLVPECTLWWIPQRMERMSKRDWLVDLQLVRPSFSRLARWYDQPEKWFIFLYLYSSLSYHFCSISSMYVQTCFIVYSPGFGLFPKSNLVFSRTLHPLLCWNDPCYKQYNHFSFYPCAHGSPRICYRLP